MTKPPVNKICFGVFASLSHGFNLRHEKQSSEISTALQSAFRVLSLTKPETPIITSMLLKIEGFKEYAVLTEKVEECVYGVSEWIEVGEREDTFAVTVRDIKRMVKVASS